MSETPEISPHILSAEYLDGHTFNAHCDMEHQPQRSREIPSTNFLIEGSLDKFAKRTLLNYIRLAEKPHIIKRFEPGSIFDGHNFPPGTIVKFHFEHLYDPKNTTYFSSLKYGVLVGCEEWPPQTRALLDFPEIYAEPGGIYWTTYLKNCIIDVGIVMHSLNEPYESSESLTRINWVQVLQYGQGMPVKANFKSIVKNFLPAFNR